MKNIDHSRLNIIKNLDNWDKEYKVKDKIVKNHFLEYFAIEKNIEKYISNVPNGYLKI